MKDKQRLSIVADVNQQWTALKASRSYVILPRIYPEATFRASPDLSFETVINENPDKGPISASERAFHEEHATTTADVAIIVPNNNSVNL